jgi:hypothetical protein
MKFYYGTTEKLQGIFSEHCNLSMEQYEWISGEFIYLEADIQEDEPETEIEARVEKMSVVFDFLLETKELTLKEHRKLKEMAEDMVETAELARTLLAREEGTPK